MRRRSRQPLAGTRQNQGWLWDLLLFSSCRLEGQCSLLCLKSSAMLRKASLGSLCEYSPDGCSTVLSFAQASCEGRGPGSKPRDRLS
mmetsp:Transcript_6392/g.17885  ORF Transcript_6392/g.17885 Transcript_6392/m.17885 type:complete len:87 (+) Transcript_6392:493-753(+)